MKASIFLDEIRIEAMDVTKVGQSDLLIWGIFRRRFIAHNESY